MCIAVLPYVSFPSVRVCYVLPLRASSSSDGGLGGGLGRESHGEQSRTADRTDSDRDTFSTSSVGTWTRIISAVVGARLLVAAADCTARSALPHVLSHAKGRAATSTLLRTSPGRGVSRSVHWSRGRRANPAQCLSCSGTDGSGLVVHHAR
jgi:hypothetical protein